MRQIRRGPPAGFALLLATALLLTGCGGEAEESGSSEAPGVPADLALAEREGEESPDESPGTPDMAALDPEGERPLHPEMALTEEEAAVAQRAICEQQRAYHPDEEYRVECTRAVTGDVRRDRYQCTCIWGG